nr:DUF6220 domain-containing protein [Sporosarcina sp. BP05]
MKNVDVRIRLGRSIYFVLAIILSLCVTTQFFLAGMAIFMSPVNWLKHLSFVHIFGFNLPFLMIGFAVVGKMPLGAYLQLLGVLLTVFTLYFTANITNIVPWLGAMHPVMGILLFALSLSIVFQIWNSITNKKQH